MTTIAGLPAAGDGRGSRSRVGGGVDGCAVDRRRGAAGPAGDAQLQGEVDGRLGGDGDADRAGPGVGAGLAERHLAGRERERGGEAAVEVDGDGVVARRDEVAADRGDQPRGVHGAAGAGVPGPAAVAAVAVQRVRVEVVLAVAGEAAERVVEERLLQHVGVAAVEVEVEHALRPEDQRDRGAGLGVGGGVGQVVGVGEAFVGGGGAEAGGDVDLRGHDVVPRAPRRRVSGWRRRARRRGRPWRSTCTWRGRRGRRPGPARGPAGATGCTRSSWPRSPSGRRRGRWASASK